MDVLEKGFSQPTDRIKALRNAIYDATPTVEADRAELITASYKETEGMPIVIRRAKAVEKILNEIPIAIRDNDLIAGVLTVSVHDLCRTGSHRCRVGGYSCQSGECRSCRLFVSVQWRHKLFQRSYLVFQR